MRSSSQSKSRVSRYIWGWYRSLKQQTALSILQNNLGSIGTGCRLSADIDWRGDTKRIHLGKAVRIDKFATIECAPEGTLKIGDGCVICSYAMLLTHTNGRIQIGEHCSINPFSVLYGHGGLKIGNNVRIATHCVIIPANHIFEDINQPIRSQGLSKQGIVIEDDVWIGAGVRILDGVTIGQGAVIGAGSVVTRSVPAFSVCTGVPAAIARRRGSRKSQSLTDS